MTLRKIDPHDLRDELDAGIRDARAKAKRARTNVSKARQVGREEGFQALRSIFLGSELPTKG